MTRHSHQDPTEFFSVVGAPHIRDRRESRFHELRTDDARPRKLEIGVASVCAAFCAVRVSLFANSSAAKFVEVAYQAVKG